MKHILKSLFIGALTTVVAAPAAFSQSGDLNAARAAAIRECNVFASPYLLYTWGNWQLYLYRECMAKRGQIE
jgi:hypothetical protein